MSAATVAEAAPPEAAPAQAVPREEPEVEEALVATEVPPPVASPERESTPAVQPAPARALQPAAEPQPAVTPPAPAGPRDATWIMRQSPEHFTLQLVSVSSAERAAQYVTNQPDPMDFAVYRLQRDGRILHVVIFGAFPNREAAEEAARHLPASIGSVKPWLRTFGQVQAGVRTALQG